ncbi:hypothetical protein niasHT_028801 [Heterodera trifolii]|uniref:BTB domain-containing protein n=1 Tax=Heterodera trifolii TaxID=157864 RepID=A0ABD2KRY8_9BILA
MFRFDSQNGKAENASAGSPIVVSDVEAKVFRVMLSFIYRDCHGKSSQICKCSANLRIVSQKNGTEDLTKNIDRVFNNKENSLGFKNFITFTDLMTNSDEGLYDSEEAKVTLAIDLTVDEERGIKRKLTDE